MNTKSKSVTKRRGAINVNVNIQTQPKIMIINGIVHSVPEGLSVAEWAKEVRSGQ